MKKFLTMALALMMVLSLFAVPTMAADPVLTETFESYADKAASQVNWGGSGNAGPIDVDEDGDNELQITVSKNNTNGNIWYLGTVPENVYEVSFRVKTDTVTDDMRVAVFTNGVSRFEAPVTTDWTTVTGTAFLRSTWMGANTSLRIYAYGVSGAVQKYFIDDVVLTPYSGNILEGLNADFEEYSTSEVVGFASQPTSTAVFSTSPTNAGEYGYDTGADDTGYSLEIMGCGKVSGVKFASGVQMPAQQLRLTFKLKSTVADADVLKVYVGGAEEYTQVSASGVWETKEILITPVTLSNAGTAMYIQSTGSVKATDAIWVDDVVMTVVANEVSEPTSFAIAATTNNAAYGSATASAATSTGDAVTFTVTPKLGYYVSAATLNGTNVLASFDAYKGGTYTTGTIAADTTLAVEFAAVTAKGEKAATLPAVFAPAADSAVTFGKVLDTTDATSWGVELTKGGVGVTPANGGSYLYKANATNANGQYAIEFIGLEAGTYQIRSYVYVNGVAEFGAPSTFVVD